MLLSWKEDADASGTIAKRPRNADTRKKTQTSGGGRRFFLSFFFLSPRGGPRQKKLTSLSSSLLEPTKKKNKKQGTASTLTRSEVQGGGKKPYAQKGTGNARIGSRRTPLKPGGGVSFGPKPKDWGIKMNKKERRLAMATALQSAAADIIVVESAAMSEPKTKALVAALASVGADPMRKNVLLVATEVGDGLQRASRNVERLAINRVSALNASDVLKADKIVVEKGALAAIQEFYGPNTRTDE